MTTKRKIAEKDGIYFITFTCYKWLNLFSITNSFDLVYHWFDILIEKGFEIIGYVIMPNHVHAIIVLENSAQTINSVVSNGKRFMAYEIIKRLESRSNTNILFELTKDLTDAEKKKGQLHHVFEPSFDVKVCKTIDFIEQKLKYIHNNPCSKKWMLANESIEYKHSSMRFYQEFDRNSNSKLTNYKFL
jgi:REP element-mobilizing transposase RayT